MINDVAIFLDLDNVVIGTTEADLIFDINLVLGHIRELTGGRIVLRRAYGDWRQRVPITKDLAAAGFELQSTVRVNNSSKNLADMQMVVDAMNTLIDGREFSTYVLITGDRDFTPLVQELRKRGKQVIGAGVRHTTSQRLADLCDHYIYYDQLASQAHEVIEEQFADLLQRAMDQLLREDERVPASLLKQRLQALTKGAFGRSPRGRGSFHKLLEEYPEQVQLQQEGTTLYVRRPGGDWAEIAVPDESTRPLTANEAGQLLQQSLEAALQDDDKVRASLLKQQMQDLSQGAFDQTLQGEKSFRKFLDRYPRLVKLEQEGSTLYVRRAEEGAEPVMAANGRPLSAEAAARLLGQALDDLLVDQAQVRASLLKQTMQELSAGAFDEAHQGFEHFRQFLEHHRSIVQLQQRGTTLMIQRPVDYVRPSDLYLYYRSMLKKRGIRVVPSAARLVLLKDMVSLLQRQGRLRWRQVVDYLAAYYESNGRDEISKSYINDVLRLARRADVIGTENGGSLASAPVFLQISGDRLFQDAVIRCDLTYLKEIQGLVEPFSLEQASIALYEDTGHSRYLKVILNRFSDNGQAGS